MSLTGARGRGSARWRTGAVLLATLASVVALAACGEGQDAAQSDEPSLDLLERNLQEADVLPVIEANNTSTGPATVELPESTLTEGDGFELFQLTPEVKSHVVRYTTPQFEDDPGAGIVSGVIEFDDPRWAIEAAKTAPDGESFQALESDLGVPGVPTGSTWVAEDYYSDAETDFPIVFMTDGPYLYYVQLASQYVPREGVASLQAVASNWFSRVQTGSGDAGAE